MSHFLCANHLSIGTYIFATTYTPRQIDSNIPAYRKELLMAWALFQPMCCIWDNIPPTTVLEEPLFHNPLFKYLDSVLHYPDWITPDIQKIKDLCYLAMPGFLLPPTIHKIISTLKPDRPPLLTSQKISHIIQAIPLNWLN